MIRGLHGCALAAKVVISKKWSWSVSPFNPVVLPVYSYPFANRATRDVLHCRLFKGMDSFWTFFEAVTHKSIDTITPGPTVFSMPTIREEFPSP